MEGLSIFCVLVARVKSRLLLYLSCLSFIIFHLCFPGILSSFYFRSCKMYFSFTVQVWILPPPPLCGSYLFTSLLTYLTPNDFSINVVSSVEFFLRCFFTILLLILLSIISVYLNGILIRRPSTLHFSCFLSVLFIWL